MQTDGQIAASKLERLLADVGLDELHVERADGTSSLRAAFSATLKQAGVAVERQRLALKELGREARQVSTARADVDDALGVLRERRQCAEERCELLSLAGAHAAQRSRRQVQLLRAERGQARAVLDARRELAELARRIDPFGEKRCEAAALAGGEILLIERQEKVEPAAIATPAGRNRRLHCRIDDVEHRREHPQYRLQLFTLAP
jgi:hypothetical protein